MQEEKSSDSSITKNKLAFNSPRNRDKILDQNIVSIKIVQNSSNFPDLQKTPKSNLCVAINNLKNDKNIEIKEADKWDL